MLVLDNLVSCYMALCTDLSIIYYDDSDTETPACTFPSMMNANHAHE